MDLVFAFIAGAFSGFWVAIQIQYAWEEDIRHFEQSKNKRRRRIRSRPSMCRTDAKLGREARFPFSRN